MFFVQHLQREGNQPNCYDNLTSLRLKVLTKSLIWKEETNPCSDVGWGKKGLPGIDYNNKFRWEKAVDMAIIKKVISMLPALCVYTYMKRGIFNFC